MDEQQNNLPSTDPVEINRIAELERLSQEHLDGWKRAKADYLNLKKQTDKEKMDLVGFATAQTVLAFIPVYDNLKRAIKHIPADQQEVDWVKGVMHIIKSFDGTLQTFGITPIPSIGAQFDPAKHHAISHVKQEGTPSGTIIDEIKTGFVMGDKVIEPAQVVVAE